MFLRQMIYKKLKFKFTNCLMDEFRKIQPKSGIQFKQGSLQQTYYKFISSIVLNPDKMFMPFDHPSATKLTLHKRSKTICVLNYKQKNSNIFPSHKNFTPKKVHYNSVKVINSHNTLQSGDSDNSKKYQSLRSMTQQIERLINKEVCYSHLSTYVQRNSGRFRTLENQNPEGYEFNDTFYAQKNKINILKCNAGFRQPEYLNLLKKTKKLNTRGFVPHFNWKQKLNRIKNVGNYGHIYKKNEKSSQKKFLSPPEPPKDKKIPEFKDYVIDSTKIMIDPQIIISRGLGLEEARQHQKMSASKRCYTSCSEYRQGLQRRLNQTLMAGQRSLNPRKFSQVNSVIAQDKTLRNQIKTEKQWKFEPWDVNKDN